MNYHFAYLVGALLFDAAWLACYLIGKNYRPQIIGGAVITTPLALTSVLFVPQYWTPPSLFNLDARIRVGIEDFLWAGAVGGIASVVGELLLKERLAELMFASTGGALWSVAYEYYQGYRFAPGSGFRLVEV